ncbi:hypothetical protein ACHAW5_002869 [Stephanodiscus triporus]|uniref:Uncharacterized protein n=1 Tax=Stephanodiscus triporus TaxID=2934178 RepID=A0ABD3PA30_9STRA
MVFLTLASLSRSRTQTVNSYVQTDDSKMKRRLPATVALLHLSATIAFALADESSEGATPSIHHDQRKMHMIRDEHPEPNYLGTIDDNFEWLRVANHSVVSDISRESPSNDDPDFVDQLLQTSVIIDVTRLTQLPTTSPTSSHGLGSSQHHQDHEHGSRDADSDQDDDEDDKANSGGSTTQGINEAVPTESPPTTNVTVPSSKSPAPSSSATTSGKPTGIPTPILTAPSSSHDLDSSQHQQDHENGSHASNSDEVSDSDDYIIQVDLPQIICDITLSPSLFQHLERKHVLQATMTSFINDLFDTHLLKPLFDLVNISLRVEVKRDATENPDTTVRLHAYFRGASFFSSRASPTQDNLINLLVRYFDVDEFNRRLMLPFRTRGAKSPPTDELIEVNAVYFMIEDGSLIQPGLNNEENALTLPNTSTHTRVVMPVVLLLATLIVIACFLALATFLWPNDDEEDTSCVTSSDLNQSRIAEQLADSTNVGAIKRAEPNNDIPSSDDTKYTPRQSPQYTLSSGVSSLSKSQSTEATNSSDGLDSVLGLRFLSYLVLSKPYEDEVEESQFFTDASTSESV